MLSDLSRQLLHVQRTYIEQQQDRLRQERKLALAEKRKREEKKQEGKAVEEDSKPLKICLTVPVTSKGTDMKAITDSPFWNNLFDSFMKSIDWRSNKIEYRFYLGFDRGDALYDTGDAWSEFREEFKNRATYRMIEQMMDEEGVNKVLNNLLSIRLLHFDGLAGSPSQVVSQLVLKAYDDGFDYFYQVNDDTVIDTPNWAPQLVQTLVSNPIQPNLGVTGPKDANNEKIFTHAFVHRTHVEV